MTWLNALVQGVLLGGIYALSATGLALVFGVMRLINMAHGDIIVLAAFAAEAITVGQGVNPLVALVVVVPGAAVLGYVLQRVVLEPTLGADPLPPLLVTFGLSIVIQNVLLTVFTADSRRLNGGWFETASLPLGHGLQVGLLPLIMFAVAAGGLLGLHLLFSATALGRAFRAVATDAETARLMGIRTEHVYALAVAIAFAFTAVAGVFLAIRTSFDPLSGPSRLIIAFEVVVIGGLGRIGGTLAGGVLLGVAQTLGAQIDPSFQLLAGHLMFLLILVTRPTGLFAGQAG